MFDNPHAEFCPACGQTLGELLSAGNLGCGMCLFHFQGPATQMVMRYQDGAYQHLGSLPLPERALLKKRAEVYRAALDKAQEEERLEDAEALLQLLSQLEAQ